MALGDLVQMLEGLPHSTVNVHGFGATPELPREDVYICADGTQGTDWYCAQHGGKVSKPTGVLTTDSVGCPEGKHIIQTASGSACQWDNPVWTSDASEPGGGHWTYPPGYREDQSGTGMSQPRQSEQSQPQPKTDWTPWILGGAALLTMWALFFREPGSSR